MTKKNRAQSLFSLLVVLSVFGAPGGGALAEPAEPLSPKLTPRLQELLRKEMQFIDGASRDILSALTAGKDAQVAELAQKIHDSFILRQSMTPEDKTHLMAVAPKEFVQMDRGFHEIAAELAQAAKASDKPLQMQEFGRMIEACSACHARYATDRFPNFAE